MASTKTTFAVGGSVEHKKYGRAKIVAINEKTNQIAVEFDNDTFSCVRYLSPRGWKSVPSFASKFKGGDAVEHPDYGRGVVVGVLSPCEIQVRTQDQTFIVSRSTADAAWDGWELVSEKIKEEPQKEIGEALPRRFTFDDSDPVIYLWIIHRLVLGEPVIVKSAQFERVGVITNAVFENNRFGVQVRLHVGENIPPSCIVWEEKASLPIRPTNFELDEAVVHPKFGSGQITGIDEEGSVIVGFLSSGVRWMKGKKLRRIHLTPQPFSVEAVA